MLGSKVTGRGPSESRRTDPALHNFQGESRDRHCEGAGCPSNLSGV